MGGIPNVGTMSAAAKQVILAVAEEAADSVLWWKFWRPKFPKPSKDKKKVRQVRHCRTLRDDDEMQGKISFTICSVCFYKVKYCQSCDKNWKKLKPLMFESESENLSFICPLVSKKINHVFHGVSILSIYITPRKQSRNFRNRLKIFFILRHRIFWSQESFTSNMRTSTTL